MKKIAITSFAFSIISLIMVSFLYIPKFNSPSSFDSSDIYLQRIATLFPELQEAIFIDSAQYNLYDLRDVWPTQFFSILNDIPIVGYRRPNDNKDRLYYEFFNKKNRMLYRITFTDFHSPRFAKVASFVVTEDNSSDYTLSEISTINSPELNFRKRIFKKDTLIQIYKHNNRFESRFYVLKKENGDISRLVDWSEFDHSFNLIRISSAQGIDEFKVDIPTKYNVNLLVHLPVFNDKTIELSITYKNQTYNTTGLVSGDNNLSETCNPNYGIPANCNFTITAPFENCNLKVRVYYDPTINYPIVRIENEIEQLMQCLNIW